MSDNKRFDLIFSHRCVICYFIVAILFFSCILRVAVAATKDYSTVIKIQTGYRISAGRLRGTIFDTNMNAITNSKSQIKAVISPTPRAITAISSVFSGDELESLLNELKKGKPVLCSLPKEINCDGIYYTKTFIHNDSETAGAHIIGSINSDGHGISGLEAAYDKLLYSDKELSFSFTTNGRGKVLEGILPEIENDSSETAKGVVSTLDINIQKIAEEAADNIEKGAVVIASAKSCELLALVSRPNYDVTKISEYLNDSDSPLLNRALSAYNVGSVFKPCVAAAAIENNKSNFCYTCTGKCKIVDRYFKCHKLSGHGYMNLKSGIANSCNTFFYNLSFAVGAEQLYKTAASLNFGRSLKICDGIYTAEGSLPELYSLSNPAQLANYSIGQGKLLLTPVSMLTLYCAIASNGQYHIPTLVKGTLENGKFTEYKAASPTKVMKESTAKTLREYLTAVISEGTGIGAMPKTVSAAGKTATAQTGRFINGKEICEAWFCGFFPAENPQYVVIVFSENSIRQKLSCGAIFASIADKINAYKNTN